MVPNWGLNIGFCCWQIGHLAVVIVSELGKWTSMLMNPYITSIPATIAIFMSLLGNNRVAGTRSRLVSTEHAIHVIRILKSFSAEVTLWRTFTWDRNIFMTFFFSFREVYPYISSLSFLVTNFPIMFLPKPWPSSHRLWIVIQLYFWSFLLSSKMNNQLYCWKFCTLGGCPFTTVLQGCPRKGW